MLTLGFPDGSSGNESACSPGDTEDTVSIPGLGGFPGGEFLMPEFLMPVESSKQRKKLPCYHDEIGLLLYHEGTREASLDLSGIYWCCHTQ